MGGLVALAREAGHKVTGCDAGVYPPMSDQLRWFTLSLLVMVLLLLTLIIGSALLTVALWPQLGWITLAVLLAVYALGAALVLRKLMGEVAAAPPVLSQTLQELSNDRDVFVARARQTMQETDVEAR